MKKIFKIAIFPLLLMLFVPNLNAKWWIFGQNKSGININYLYINNISLQDTSKELTIPESSLDSGYLHIRGQAISSGSQIGKVFVSIDGKKRWEKAKLTKDGAFEFTFEPETDKTYDMYIKIINTLGKTNNIDATHKVITIKDINAREMIEDTLDKLKTAYENENTMAFMRYVDPDFTGDATTLEFAIKKDFSLFDNIQIDFTISSIAYQDGKYFVAINFNRSLESSATGEIYTDKGITEFTFKQEQGKAMLYSMKNPLIFGLSDANEVADGNVVSSENDSVIIVNDGGKITKGNISNIINDTSMDTEGGTIELKSNGAFDPGTGDSEYDGFIFSQNAVVAYGTGDINPTDEPYLSVGNGALIYNFAMDGVFPASIDDVHSIVSDSSFDNIGVPVQVGDVGEVKLSNGKYVVFQVLSVTSTTFTIKWKYF